MTTKHVCESLNQFADYKFFNLLEKKDEKERDKDDKKEFQDMEKEGMTIIKKAQDNFKRFQSAAGNKILKYKEFWEENQEAKKNFAETGSIYKMFDSNYVLGTLTLPDEALSDQNLDQDMDKVEAVEEDEQFNIGDAEDLSKDKAPDTTAVDLEKPVEEKPAEETSVDGADLDGAEKPAEEEPAQDFEMGEETPAEDKKMSFVVFDVSGAEREEIFRCQSNNVIKAFNDFYENTFKGSMRTIKTEYEEKQKAKKLDAEKKLKEKESGKKRQKLDKFLGES